MGKKKVKKGKKSKDESSRSPSKSKSDDQNSSINIKKKKANKKSKSVKSPEVKDVTPVVKVVDKKAIVDPHFPDRAQYHIYPDTDNEFNGKFFSCTLNKSDLEHNNNKFYIIQLLEHDTSNELILFTRWGRVGVPGAHEIKNVDSRSGPRLFMKKYKDKTKGGYQEIFIDYEAEVKQEEAPKVNKINDSSKKKFKTTLDPDVMELISLIYNKKMITDNLHEIGYDSEKMPLGKLSPITLTNGLNILKEIEAELKKKKPDKDNLKKYSSEFYTQIPHNFGFQKMSNFIIDSLETVKEKIDMISVLSDMKITLNILENVDKEKNDEYENEEDKQIHDYYKQLKCDIRTISPNEEIYSILNKYLTAKVEEDNSNYNSYYGYRRRLSLVKAYELNRHGEKEKFMDKIGNKKLLWHGSRMTNFVGILSQGLRIAPPEAPSSGYLYGKGVYFADMAQKSSGYCYPVNNNALILLGEVALGKEDQRKDIDSNLPRTLEKDANSVHALSRLEPKDGVTINEDVFVPNGNAIINEKNDYCSNYAEYIVYNVDQIRLRYLLRIKYD